MCCWKVFSVSFTIVCILTSLALTTYETIKYSKNEDMSLVGESFYLETQKDEIKTKNIYPVLSFCFENPFLKEKLKKRINMRFYLQYLEGNLTS
jgi:hypothetical protein